MKMKRLQVILLTLLLSAFINGCGNTKQDGKNEEVELTVSAAASLKGALEEIGTEFEKGEKNIKVHFNYGASGTLQQQIVQGAPVDLFFSAAEDKYDLLVNDQLIEKGKDLVGNEIVLIARKGPQGKIHSFVGLKNASQIAIGTPEVVPAGEYGRQTLETLGLWDKIEPKIVYTKDVRQALSYVETGNADAGIVYRTDMQQSEKAEIVKEAPQDSHKPIVYPLGIIKNTRHPEESERFYDFLLGDKAMDILKKYGFKELE